MVFNSVAFLSVFLPASFLLYLLIPSERGKNLALCLLSLVFYTFGGLAQVPVLLLAALWNWAFGLAMQISPRPKRLCGVGVAGNLALLGFYKYVPFLLSARGLDVAFPALPLGVSFFTFQGISYLVDVCRDPAGASRRFDRLFLYLAFFPRLLAGPIVRYREATAELDRRELSAADAAAGLRRFVKGLCKKLLISETVGALADTVFALAPETLGPDLAWLGAVSYCLQLFFDFSGYSDMAIGLGRLFGFHFPENFDDPYIAGSVSEFWRRWHITLNRWFVEYVYIPLGGSRRGQGRAFANRMLVFLLTGIWHGAGWTFLLWGLWHGLFVSLEGQFPDVFRRLRAGAGGRALLHAYTLLVVILGFVMFRAGSVTQGLGIIGRMFSPAPAGVLPAASAAELLTGARIAALLAGLLFSAPVLSRLWRKAAPSAVGSELTQNTLALLGLMLCLLAMAGGNFRPFLYQQF